MNPMRKTSARGANDFEIISRARFQRTVKLRGWNLDRQVRECHDEFVPSGGVIFRRDAALKRMLQTWNADLGARHKMNWPGFFERYCRILRPLLELPVLGELSAAQLATAVRIVDELETFKSTQGRALVFGSKAAHFHFPWIVPVISSEVQRGLRVMQREHASTLERFLGGGAPWFEFGSAPENRRSYEAYLRLGNGLMKGVDTAKVIGGRTEPYGVHAKIFEWCIVSFDPKLSVIDSDTAGVL